eukprot:GFUD01039753.1.p1 GENE.GFUD01039753.1~~GFUD01039753.1.p1  ORF type:complete len:108 (+),score=9.97 GFUD01039753.1:290-613(+)
MRGYQNTEETENLSEKEEELSEEFDPESPENPGSRTQPHHSRSPLCSPLGDRERGGEDRQERVPKYDTVVCSSQNSFGEGLVAQMEQIGETDWAEPNVEDGGRVLLR